MNILGRTPQALITPSINWLLWIAVTCLLVVLGLKVFFDNLQSELHKKSENEQARLFVGDDIVRGIQGIEKDLYHMLAATSETDVARMRHSIDHHIDKTEHDLNVLSNGGTVERLLQLNLEGREEMTQTATYHPDPEVQGHVMELIEIAPLLDKMGELTDTLEFLVLRRIDCESRADQECLERVSPELALFLKQAPAHFERISENANRLFFESSGRLSELEAQIDIQRKRLKRIEMGLIALVMVLAGLGGVVFLQHINEANLQREVALDEMRAAKEGAERASRAKSEFVSRMSHELRTPLNAIIGFAELLESEALSPPHRNYVNLINSSGKHLVELINAVLDHAKIEAGGMTLEKVAFDFSAIIEDVKTIVTESAHAKGLDFVATIATDLPRFVVGDPTRLRQILINLLVNAVKFTERGSVELHIAPEDGRIIFSVRDTGIGMDEAALARLFKPFSQADDSVTRKFGGTGLGLLITKELIEAMGGGIDVDSAPGVGSAFWFWLPLQPAQAARAAPATTLDTESPSSEPIAELVTGRILLVEDNRVNQQLAGAMLDRLGLACECVDNGADALRRLAAADYALVLMDMEMPEMDGVTATRRIRAREAERGARHLPIIAMTANALQEDRASCFAAGMDGFVSKPISLAALQDELRRLFAGEAPAREGGACAAPAAASDAVFDRAAAIDMMGDAELFQELAGIYVADAPGYLRELDAALAAADGAKLARVAHTLKGLFATFAAAPGKAAAARLEQTARNGDMTACKELAAMVRGHVDALAGALGA